MIRGRVWTLGDDIDTNVLAPGQPPETLGLSGEAARAHLIRACLSAVRPGLAELVRPGDILVAGRHFGQGSHRERANTALIEMGFAAVVAESLARLFFRNSVAFGAPAIECPGITALVAEGETLEIDLGAGVLRNLDRGGTLGFAPPTPTVREILEAGGMLALLRRRLGVVTPAG
jgi:3-isopropylmalate/(R)-2-methylmalate dehydratase small subunit